MSEQDATEPDAASEPEDGDGAGDGDQSDRAYLDDIVGEAGALDDVDTEDVDEALIEQVAEAKPEEIARQLVGLGDRIETLEKRLDEQTAAADDLESRLKRKQAEFQNYKKRQKERLEDEKQRATEDLVARLVDVRDNLQRALDQEEGTDIRGGVESTLRQFDDELDRENVERIEPEPGEDVDPKRHEALATIASDQPEDTVAELHRPGYEMAGKVIRTAQVAISDGSNKD
jgi:molecular chaperone GrpE